ESQPLFGNLLEVAAEAPAPPVAAAAAADRLFGLRTDIAAEAREVFGGPAAPAPAATRILPDLSARAPAPAEDEKRTPREPRVEKLPKPRIPAPKPIAIVMPEPAPAVRRTEAAPAARKPLPVRIRRPRQEDDEALPRGERWKRRLPRFAR